MEMSWALLGAEYVSRDCEAIVVCMACIYQWLGRSS